MPRRLSRASVVRAFRPALAVNLPSWRCTRIILDELAFELGD
jgi:hypothetical protein